jgi:hypothetical protein
MTEKTSRIDDRYATNEKYTTLRGIHRDAQRHLSEVEWNYLWCGTGDEVTLKDNTAAFDRYRFVAPLFAGIDNPDTRTNVLGFDLSFPAFIAPFGGRPYSILTDTLPSDVRQKPPAFSRWCRLPHRSRLKISRRLPP